MPELFQKDGVGPSPMVVAALSKTLIFPEKKSRIFLQIIPQTCI
jgi:hypothetical protein